MTWDGHDKNANSATVVRALEDRVRRLEAERDNFLRFAGTVVCGDAPDTPSPRFTDTTQAIKAIDDTIRSLNGEKP
jgi:hypothetical protein